MIDLWECLNLEVLVNPVVYVYPRIPIKFYTSHCSSQVRKSTPASCSVLGVNLARNDILHHRENVRKVFEGGEWDTFPLTVGHQI